MSMSSMQCEPHQYCEWRSTGSFSRLIADSIDEMEPRRLFGRPGKKLFEGWIAARFARATKAKAVRLCDTRCPDAQVSYAHGLTLGLELTEALDPERERQVEITEWVEQGCPPREIDQLEIERLRSLILPTLESRIRAKCAKDYPRGTHLVVYLNICGFGWWQEEISSQFMQLAKLARDHFPVVWVIWNGDLWRLPTAPVDVAAGFRPRATRELGWAVSLKREKCGLDEIFSRDENGFRHDR